MRNLSVIFIFIFLYFNGIHSFDNDTVITIEPRFFFKELLQIWSLYFFRSKPVESVTNSYNITDHNSTRHIKIVKNITENDANEEQRRIFPCMLNQINYWNYKNGGVKIPIVLQIDRNVDKENSKAVSAAINSTETSKSEAKKCTFIFIYAKWCRFSVAAAPMFNALGRIYPQLEFIALAINNFQEFKWNLHTSYVPRIKMYFGNKAVREYNGTDDNLDGLVDFVFSNTGQLPLLAPQSVEDDYMGPVSSQLEATSNVWLVISWILTVLCSLYLAISTTRGRQVLAKVLRCVK